MLCNIYAIPVTDGKLCNHQKCHRKMQYAVKTWSSQKRYGEIFFSILLTLSNNDQNCNTTFSKCPEFSCWLCQFSYTSCCMYVCLILKGWYKSLGVIAYTTFVCWCWLWHLKLYMMCIYKSWHIGCVTKNMSIK